MIPLPVMRPSTQIEEHQFSFGLIGRQGDEEEKNYIP
jgi:hypothetical protein